MTSYDLNNFCYGKVLIHSEEFINGNMQIGNYFCINKKGEILFKLPSAKMICCSFSNKDYATVFFNEKQALINSNGEFLTDFCYQNIIIDDRFAFVRKDEKWGVIDFKGNVIIPLMYDDYFTFDRDCAVLLKAGKYGIVDFQNQIIVPFEYDNIGTIGKELISVQKGDKWGLIDIENKVVMDFMYDELYAVEGNDEVFIVQQNNKWGVVDKYNKILEDFLYKEALFSDELVALKKEEKYALFSMQNKQFITDFLYSKNAISSNKHVIYKNVFSFNDTYGKSAIKLNYEKFFENYFEYNNSELAVITKAGKYGVIDKNWNVVIPFEYKKICFGWDSNLILATKFDNSQGYIDRFNNTVIPFGKYYLCSPFYEGVAKVFHETKGRIFINENATEIEIKA